MTDEPLRVALLARPGPARDRLLGVIGESGAQQVLEADPTSLEPAALAGAAPQLVLVVLDPATEDALDRFDDVLFDSGVDVIYEEAELIAAREGWEVARWQRHLLAKLQRHGDVLPPGREPEDDEETLPSGLEDESTGAAAATDAGLELYRVVDSAADAASPDGTLAAPPAEEASVDTRPTGDGTASEELEVEWAEDADGSSGSDGAVELVPEAMFASTPAEANPFDPVLAEGGDAEPFETLDVDFSFSESPGEAGPHASDIDPAFEVHVEPAEGLALEDSSADSAGDASGGFEESAGAEDLNVADGEKSLASGEPEAGRRTSSFGELSLHDPDTEADAPAPSVDAGEAKNRFQRDLMDLESRISGLELVDDSPVRGPEKARGAVLVVAGIGGPDAVRQLLGAIPNDFPRPILIQQRLDGGRHDKLVAQMQRATSLAVRLAQDGQPLEAGCVYILPASVGVREEDGDLLFRDGADATGALPAADSAVLLLSGSDPALVDIVMKQGWAGALVAGQAADGCYDPAAPNALAARGGDTAPPVELARRLAERWAT
ncbi:MAG: chemotaxis protein CheB [Lysobacter spongiicola]|nr:chemotaxis protein CheB [Lysobacter spongiicola]